MPVGLTRRGTTGALVALTPRDRDLIQRCLHHEPGSWNDFVDRFLGLVYHVAQHTADSRSYTLKPEDAEDIAAQVLLRVVENDYAALRQFRGHSSLATYLTVIARRVCVQELARRASGKEHGIRSNSHPVREEPAAEAAPGKGMEAAEELHHLLQKLPDKERTVVKLYFLEGRSYEEISKELTIPVNSIGPILSRARKRMQEGED
jgi:RNA polymerase sigma-70 factor (ECF subfamily)